MMKGMIAINTKHTGDPGRDHRGYAESMTSEQVDSLLSEDWLRKMVADIRNGDEKKKDLLPYICPHYAAFRNNHRAQADIMPETFSFMTCVDVDDKELVEKAIQRAMEVNGDAYSDWQDQVLRIEYSARKKVHIYIRIPKGMTIEEAQQAFCKEIAVPFDESCITPERFIYLTGRDEEVYRSPHWLEPLSEEEIAERREAYLQRGLDVDGRKLHKQASQENKKRTSSVAETSNIKASAASLAAFDLCAQQAGLTQPQTYDILMALSQRHLISFIPRRQVPFIRYMQRREDKEHIQIPSSIYEDRLEQYRERIEAMLHYVQTDDRCRSRLLLDYFGEKSDHDCGQCDVCLAEQGLLVTDRGQRDARKQILALLDDHQRHHITELYRLQLPAAELNSALTWLIQEERIRQTDGYISL